MSQPRQSGRWGPALGLAAVLLAVAASAMAQTAPVRVAYWRVEPPTLGGTNPATALVTDAEHRSAVEALRQAEPDVVLLNGAVDWNVCLALAERLKPLSLKPVACSTFKSAAGSRVSQAAILARTAPVVSWTEPWPDDPAGPIGGMAFAAIRLGTNVTGFCALAASAAGAHDRSGPVHAASVLRQTAAAEQWTANRVTSFVVAGFLPASGTNRAQVIEEVRRVFAEASFASTPLPTTGRRSGANPLFLVKNGVAAGELAESGRIKPIAESPAVFTVELDRPSAVHWVSATPPEPVLAVPAVPDARPVSPVWLGVGAGLGLGLVLVIILRRSRARRIPDSLLPVPVSRPGAIVDPSLAASGAESVRAAWLPHLAGILREKFVAALVSHRSELLETQHAGAAQAEALEERLQKVQGELAERVKGFERRIAELELALAVAEEQKRGLIQAQIDLTKQLLAQARQAEHQGRFGRENLGSN